MYEEIKSIIADVANVDSGSIERVSRLKGLMDSLSVLEVMLAVESRYGVKFDQCEIDENVTVDDIVRLVKIKAGNYGN